MVLAASWDGSLRVWDLESCSVVNTFTGVHTNAIFDGAVMLQEAGAEGNPTLLRCPWTALRKMARAVQFRRAKGR